MNTAEWIETIEVIKYANAYFANHHITKQIPVKAEDTEGLEKLVKHPTEKGHLVWIPF